MLDGNVDENLLICAYIFNFGIIRQLNFYRKLAMSKYMKQKSSQKASFQIGNLF